MYWKNNEKKFSLSCTNFHQKQWAQNPQKFVLCLTPTLDFHNLENKRNYNSNNNKEHDFL